MWTGLEAPSKGAKPAAYTLVRKKGPAGCGRRGKRQPLALMGSGQETHPAKNWADSSAPTKSAPAPGPLCADQPRETHLPGLGARGWHGLGARGWHGRRPQPVAALRPKWERAEIQPPLGMQAGGFSRPFLTSLCSRRAERLSLSLGAVTALTWAFARRTAPAQGVRPGLPLCFPVRFP